MFNNLLLYSYLSLCLIGKFFNLSLSVIYLKVYSYSKGLYKGHCDLTHKGGIHNQIYVKKISSFLTYI